MMRNFFLAVSLIAALAMHPQVSSADEASVHDDVKQAQVRLDQAFVQQDSAAIMALVTADQVAITPYLRRPVPIAGQIETLAAFKARLFDITPAEVDLIGEGAALLTYEKSYEGTFEGRPLPARVFVSSLWEKEDGKWRQRLYQETAIDPYN
jgi:ketosteroid isomerase-like protein